MSSLTSIRRRWHRRPSLAATGAGRRRRVRNVRLAEKEVPNATHRLGEITMRLKTRGGTVEHGQPSLCLTCRSATMVKGPRLRDEIVECSRLGGRVTFPVSSCSGYINRNHPTIREMEDIAWI